MSTLGTNVTMRPASDSDGEISPPEKLLRAFNELRDELVSTLWFMLGNREDAQDAAQEAFLKCWRAQAGLKDVRDLRAWIFRVGLNAAKDLQRSAWYRRAKLLNGEEVMLQGNDTLPVQELENKETLERLRRAILDLRQDEKEVFLLRQNGDLTYEQIAEIRHSPVGTVKTQMRKRLAKAPPAISVAGPAFLLQGSGIVPPKLEERMEPRPMGQFLLSGKNHEKL